MYKIHQSQLITAIQLITKIREAITQYRRWVVTEIPKECISIDGQDAPDILKRIADEIKHQINYLRFYLHESHHNPANYVIIFQLHRAYPGAINNERLDIPHKPIVLACGKFYFEENYFTFQKPNLAKTEEPQVLRVTEDAGYSDWTTVVKSVVEYELAAFEKKYMLYGLPSNPFGLMISNQVIENPFDCTIQMKVNLPQNRIMYFFKAIIKAMEKDPDQRLVLTGYRYSDFPDKIFLIFSRDGTNDTKPTLLANVDENMSPIHPRPSQQPPTFLFRICRNVYPYPEE